MSERHAFLDLYRRTVLTYPALVISLCLAVIIFFAVHVPQFRIDASSDSLVLRSDKSLDFYREIRDRYGSDDYLIITFESKSAPLFDRKTLDRLWALHQDIDRIDRIESVLSMMNVPLLRGPDVTLQTAQKGLPELNEPEVDPQEARKELTESPLYKNILTSSEGDIASLLVTVKRDEQLNELQESRAQLRSKKREGTLSAKERRKLQELEQKTQARQSVYQQRQQELIERVRSVLRKYEDKARLHLGGVPMIVADSVSFIEKDIKTFGLGVLGLIILVLGAIFRSKRWVFLPIVTCLSVAVTVIGILGFFKWPATIVSANFVALIMIFTLSFCVHQIVRYRETRTSHPDMNSKDLVTDMVRAIGLPCFYMAVTTIVAFASLVISEIKPVIDFGWMMVMGIIVALILSFTLFPAALVLMNPARPARLEDMTARITHGCSYLVENYQKSILGLFVLLMALCAYGMTQLSVQNRFIDYYQDDTDIYKGMLTIDQRLGGTTPMDVILDAPQDYIEYQKQEREDMEAMGFAPVSDQPELLQGYWFSDLIFTDIKEIHQYLESLPATGKVISIYTISQVLKNLAEEELDRFEMGVIYQKLPPDIKEMLFDPYISDDGNQIRFSVRVYESRKDLNRQALIGNIREYLTQDMGYNEQQVHLTGLVVLYNNVLQSLFGSQIKTIWVVFVALFLVFLILFRNLKMALVALIPNIAVVILILGIMGGAGIPLDIMTITIAAISFGMANDDTIHYVHRFTSEFKKLETKDYKQAVRQSHTTIGRAMFFTTLIIALGFSILAFSNFVPTIYFGLLTGLSMFTALIADLVLLPILIMMIKPFGPEVQTGESKG